MSTLSFGSDLRPSFRKVILAIVLGAGALGMGCAPHLGAIHARAQDDFKCAGQDVEVAYVGLQRYQAKGCEQTAFYVCGVQRGPFAEEREMCSRVVEKTAARVVEEPKATPARAAGQAAAKPPAFPREPAIAVVGVAASFAAECGRESGPRGEGHARVRFAPSGEVDLVEIIEPTFKGTPAGACVERAFARARVAAFAGSPVVVKKTFVVLAPAETTGEAPSEEVSVAPKPQ